MTGRFDITTAGTGCPELPVGKILCVGRNYAAHAAEMGAAPPASPLLFLKPATALVRAGAPIHYPHFTRELHHEVELVVRLGSPLSRATRTEAETAVDACAVGLDLTARDVQREAKEKGLPWTLAKGFDGAAPVSSWQPVGRVSELSALELRLLVNGETRQEGNTRAMLFPIAALLEYASQFFRLLPGDLFFTGTPEGVGPLQAGDRFRAELGPALVWEGQIEPPREARS